MDIEKYIGGLDPEQQEKARACKSVEELMALAKEEGVTVPDEALAAIAGGAGESVNCGQATCPKCGGHNIEIEPFTGVMICKDCGYMW